MTSTPKLNMGQRALFTAKYFASKLSVLSEVESPKLQFMSYELRYTLSNVLGSLNPKFGFQPTWNSAETLITTKWGRFRVRPKTQDAAVISPAFERDDFMYLVGLVRKQLNTGHPVCFLDLGANIGKFTISLGFTFKSDPVRIFAIEALKETFSVLRDSADLNGLDASKVTLINKAVMDVPGKLMFAVDETSYGNSTLMPTSDHKKDREVEVEVIPIDSLEISPSNDNEVLIVKMDVEGVEIPTLKGGRETWKRFKRVYFVVEDTLNTDAIHAHLEELGARKIRNTSVYNSWWTIER